MLITPSSAPSAVTNLARPSCGVACNRPAAVVASVFSRPRPKYPNEPHCGLALVVQLEDYQAAIQKAWSPNIQFNIRRFRRNVTLHLSLVNNLGI